VNPEAPELLEPGPELEEPVLLDEDEATPLELLELDDPGAAELLEGLAELDELDDDGREDELDELDELELLEELKQLELE
jgi:hypothetical protein